MHLLKTFPSRCVAVMGGLCWALHKASQKHLQCCCCLLAGTDKPLKDRSDLHRLTNWSDVLCTVAAATHPLETQMASSLRSAHRDFAELDTSGGDPRIWCTVRGIRRGAADCSWKNGRRAGQEGMFGKCMVSIGMVLLLLQCALAVEGKGMTKIHYQALAATT